MLKNDDDSLIFFMGYEMEGELKLKYDEIPYGCGFIFAYLIEKTINIVIFRASI